LRRRRRPQVRLAIIKALTVDMVYNHPLADLYNLSVHIDASLIPFSLFAPFSPQSVPVVAAPTGAPPVSAQTLVIIRVNDSVFAAGQRYPAKRVPIPRPPTQQQKQNDGPLDPFWYVKTNPDIPLPCWWESAKCEYLNPNQSSKTILKCSPFVNTRATCNVVLKPAVWKLSISVIRACLEFRASSFELPPMLAELAHLRQKPALSRRKASP
jgi:hypothetical protein